MTPKESAQLIKAAGGDMTFATLLGIATDESARQRVNNWKRRGIPLAIQLEHSETLQKLRDKARRPS
jgi:hypothetical protein